MTKLGIIIFELMKVENSQGEKFAIFHFNDVYNIQPYSKEPKAGAAYFNSLLQREKKKYQHTLTLFSGDAFSPSLISTQLQGENMIKPLQAFGIDLACYGNHDLDYQLEHVMDMTKRTNFPWLLSNVYDKRTQRRLAEGLEYMVLQRNGLRIGVFSLAEQEWIDTLYPYYKQICQYIPFIDFASIMVDKLRKEEKCEMVIALTHMMKTNDVKLAKNVQGIDLILGGHDHLIVHEKVNDSVIIKSGTDFRNFSILKIYKKGQLVQKQAKQNSILLSNSRWTVQVELKEVHHQRQNITPDPQLDHYIQDIYKQFKQKQESVACYTLKDLDLRFSTIRKEQSPFLEFLASIYRHQSEADLAIMNSGNFRMDTYIKAGPVTFGVIENVITDKIVVKLVPGKTLLLVLENCVSMYPNLAGRYSAFSGISFYWDASKKAGERILLDSVKIHQEMIDLNRVYKVAVHSFASEGGDGYQCLKECKLINNDNDKYNRQLIHDLLHINHYLLDSYIPKYPGRFTIIEKDNHKYLQLNLPDPKNVHMIMSTGHPYESHE